MTIADIIAKEDKRQAETINLIASENYVSDNVKKALASNFTNKYAEGTPGRRYYSGNRFVDEMEERVATLAQQLFSTDYHVNIQPYSGSIANLAVYVGLLEPGDVFMGLELSHGGHLTHGHNATLTGKLYDRYAYFVDEKTGLINYDQLESEATELKPKLIISGASAYSRLIDFERIGQIAKKVGAYHLADISHISGLIATGLHPTPFGNADIVMTTTHKILRGPRGALLFCRPELTKQIDKAVFPGLQGGPHLNNMAAIGVALEEALDPNYREYCRQVVKNAIALSKALSEHGLTIVSGGTDNHLFLIDLRPLAIGGSEAQDKLEQAGITVNKNAIPYDEAGVQNPSGIRLGTPAVTTRGMTEQDMVKLADSIAQALKV